VQTPKAMSLRLLTPILLSLAGLIIIVVPLTQHHSSLREESSSKIYSGSNIIRYELNNHLIEDKYGVRAEVSHSDDLFYLTLWMGTAYQDRVTFVLKNEIIQKEAEAFELDNPSQRYLSFQHHTTHCLYSSDDYYTGMLMIHQFDTTQRVIAGSFEFIAFSEDCQELLKVENGFFDATYTNLSSPWLR
jgi:hypothetical protein